MNPRTNLLSLALLLAASIAAAEQAIIVQLPSGEIIAGVVLINGQRIPLQITVIHPNPIKPPTTAAVHSVVLYESGATDQQLAVLFSKIRANPNLSKKILILDQDTEDENGNTDKLVVSAKQLIGSKELPCLVGFNKDGKAVVAEDLPKDIIGIEEQLKKWGVL